MNKLKSFHVKNIKDEQWLLLAQLIVLVATFLTVVFGIVSGIMIRDFMTVIFAIFSAAGTFFVGMVLCYVLYMIQDIRKTLKKKN